VAYEMFTGNHPFGGESFSSPIHKVVNEDPFPMKNFQSSTPDVLEKIVFKTWEKSSGRRYGNGLDFASDLSTLLSHLERPESDISF
jgi:serine/threonine protein kinase